MRVDKENPFDDSFKNANNLFFLLKGFNEATASRKLSVFLPYS